MTMYTMKKALGGVISALPATLDLLGDWAADRHSQTDIEQDIKGF